MIQECARQLRRELTPAERRLWQHLRGGQLDGYEFRRQYSMGRFIVDFYCPQAKVVIEVDGDSHADQAAYDAERSAWLQAHKHCRVVRFTNAEIHENLAGVLDTIVTVLRTQLTARASSLALLRARSGTEEGTCRGQWKLVRHGAFESAAAVILHHRS